MAIPYNTVAETGTSVRNVLGGHMSVHTGGGFKHVEDIQVKHSGSWRNTKAVWVKSGGSWRKVHEGEHFLFNVTIGSDGTGEWSLSSYITSQGYNGNLIKGLVTVNSTRQQLNLGNFSGDS